MCQKIWGEDDDLPTAGRKSRHHQLDYQLVEPGPADADVGRGRTDGACAPPPEPERSGLSFQGIRNVPNTRAWNVFPERSEHRSSVSNMYEYHSPETVVADT